MNVSLNFLTVYPKSFDDSHLQTGQLPPTIHAGLHPVGDSYGAPTGREKGSLRAGGESITVTLSAHPPLRRGHS